MRQTSQPVHEAAINKATNFARLLGAILIVIGMLSVGLTAPFMDKQAGTAGMIALIGLGAMYVVPGILFWIFSEPLRMQKEWAGVVLIVLASLVALGEAAAVVSSLIQITGGTLVVRGTNVGMGFYLGFLFFLTLAVVIFAVSIEVITKTVASIKAIRQIASQNRALGFQPVMPPAGMPPQGPGVPPPGQFGSGQQ